MISACCSRKSFVNASYCGVALALVTAIILPIKKQFHLAASNELLVSQGYTQSQADCLTSEVDRRVPWYTGVTLAGVTITNQIDPKQTLEAASKHCGVLILGQPKSI